MYASINGFTDVVRELIAADGSVEHLRMQSSIGKTALYWADWADNDEITALLTAAEAAADAGAVASPPEGKAREGDEEDSPLQSQGGAQPKKALLSE